MYSFGIIKSASQIIIDSYNGMFTSNQKLYSFVIMDFCFPIYNIAAPTLTQMCCSNAQVYCPLYDYTYVN